MPTIQNHEFAINIFFPDGDPDGFRVVEKTGWQGKGVVCPRSLFPEKKKDLDFQKSGVDEPGVYVLMGVSDETGIVKSYIGEGDPILNRLNQHYADPKKEFWTTVIFFTSTNHHLNKAHIQYLESRLIKLASETKQCDLENGNFPSLPSLSKTDIAEAENFLREMLLCFPVLGVRIFEQPAEKRIGRNVSLLHLEAKGVKATGYEAEDGFVVCQGSQAVINETSSLGKARQDRASLLAQNVLKEENGIYVFMQDYTLSSPSNASSVILGMPSSGAQYWEDENGISLKELRERESKLET